MFDIQGAQSEDVFIYKSFIVYVCMLIGLCSIASSLYSVKPASDARYEELIKRSELDPDSVSDEEWMESEDDAGLLYYF